MVLKPFSKEVLAEWGSNEQTEDSSLLEHSALVCDQFWLNESHTFNKWSKTRCQVLNVFDIINSYVFKYARQR